MALVPRASRRPFATRERSRSEHQLQDRKRRERAAAGVGRMAGPLSTTRQADKEPVAQARRPRKRRPPRRWSQPPSSSRPLPRRRLRLLRPPRAPPAPSSPHQGGRRTAELSTRVRLRVLGGGEEMSSGSQPRAEVWGACLLAAALLTWPAAFPPPASAAPTKPAQCAARRLGAGHGAFHFVRSSPAFRRVAACGSGPGLGVAHRPTRTAPGRSGAWVATAPAGTYFIRGRLMARGRRDGAYTPRLLLDAPGSEGARPESDRRETASRPLTGEPTPGPIACWRSSGAPMGPSAAAGPTYPRSSSRRRGFISSTLAAGPHRAWRRAVRGSRSARNPEPHDEGPRPGGGHPAGFGGREPHALRLGGAELQGRTRQLALALSPCPNLVRRAIRVDTRLAGFHEGENTIAVCAEDYADASPNQRCARRRVRIDNDCPISDPAPKLNARLSFAGGEVAKRVRFGAGPWLSAGSPVAPALRGGEPWCASRLAPHCITRPRDLSLRRCAPTPSERFRRGLGPARHGSSTSPTGAAPSGW